VLGHDQSREGWDRQGKEKGSFKKKAKNWRESLAHFGKMNGWSDRCCKHNSVLSCCWLYSGCAVVKSSMNAPALMGLPQKHQAITFVLDAKFWCRCACWVVITAMFLTPAMHCREADRMHFCDKGFAAWGGVLGMANNVAVAWICCRVGKEVLLCVASDGAHEGGGEQGRDERYSLHEHSPVVKKIASPLGVLWEALWRDRDWPK
jgi:hypothetical protein